MLHADLVRHAQRAKVAGDLVGARLRIEPEQAIEVLRHRVGADGDGACVRRPDLDADRARSYAQLPRQHDTAYFDGSAPVCLSGAFFGLQDRSMTVQLNDDAAF